jgi:hypothetical protein
MKHGGTILSITYEIWLTNYHLQKMALNNKKAIMLDLDIKF